MSDRIPSYRKKKTTTGVFAAATLADGNGVRRDVMLGQNGTAAGRAEYRRVLGEWEANGRRLQKHGAKDMTVNEKVPSGRPWSRNFVNRCIGRIKRMFKWAVENEMISPTILHALQSVRGLMRGKARPRKLIRRGTGSPADAGRNQMSSD